MKFRKARACVGARAMWSTTGLWRRGEAVSSLAGVMEAPAAAAAAADTGLACKTSGCEKERRFVVGGDACAPASRNSGKPRE